jgi:hypothetical protein
VLTILLLLAVEQDQVIQLLASVEMAVVGQVVIDVL